MGETPGIPQVRFGNSVQTSVEQRRANKYGCDLGSRGPFCICFRFSHLLWDNGVGTLMRRDLQRESPAQFTQNG